MIGISHLFNFENSIFITTVVHIVFDYEILLIHLSLIKYSICFFNGHLGNKGIAEQTVSLSMNLSC